MPFIKNSTETATLISTAIEQAASGFSIRKVGQYAAKNVEVDAECDQTYSEGGSIAAEFQQHLNNASGFVSQVSQKLDEADKKAALNNQLIQNLPLSQAETPDPFGALNLMFPHAAEK